MHISTRVLLCKLRATFFPTPPLALSRSPARARARALSLSLSRARSLYVLSAHRSLYVLDAGALFDKLLDLLDLHVHFDEDDPVAVGPCCRKISNVSALVHMLNLSAKGTFENLCRDLHTWA